MNKKKTTKHQPSKKHVDINNKKNKKKSLKSKLKTLKIRKKTKNLPSGSVVFTTVLVILFLHWLFTTLIPVLIVETRYQYKKTMMAIFKTTSLKEVFVPDFSSWTHVGLSKYKQYGIDIPDIFIDEKVIFNVDPSDPKQYKEALNAGIAHASGTSLPGEPGLGYYFAHSSSMDLRIQRNAIFYLLRKLEKNDSVYIWHENEKHHYKVYETKITEADDVDFFKKIIDTEEIVLQTCWPPGTTHKRLLVFAKRVE